MTLLITHYFNTLVAGWITQVDGATARRACVALVGWIAHVLCTLDGHTGITVKLIGEVRAATLLADIATYGWIADTATLSTLKTRIHCLHQFVGEFSAARVNGILRDIKYKCSSQTSGPCMTWRYMKQSCRFITIMQGYILYNLWSARNLYNTEG